MIAVSSRSVYPSSSRSNRRTTTTSSMTISRHLPLNNIDTYCSNSSIICSDNSNCSKLVDRSGYLFKRSGIFNIFRRVYVVLHLDEIIIYKTEQDAQLQTNVLDRLNIIGIQLEQKSQSPQQFTLCLRLNETKHIFQASTTIACDEWCQSILTQSFKVSHISPHTTNNENNSKGISRDCNGFDNSPRCHACHVLFSTLTRAHHCRRCFHSLCGPCSRNRVRIPEMGYNTLVRACNHCYRILTASKLVQEKHVLDRLMKNTINTPSPIPSNLSAYQNSTRLNLASTPQSSFTEGSERSLSPPSSLPSSVERARH